jgi:hypothetical protein
MNAATVGGVVGPSGQHGTSERRAAADMAGLIDAFNRLRGQG